MTLKLVVANYLMSGPEISYSLVFNSNLGRDLENFMVFRNSSNSYKTESINLIQTNNNQPL